MGRKSFFILILICVLALALSVCCKKKDRGEGGVPVSQSQSPGELQVLSASPKGQTSSSQESDALVVIFDKPMVPLESLPEGKGASFLKLSPSFSGKHRWLGTKTLTFTPDERFPYSTEIGISAPAGIKSINGHILEENVSWMFRTVRPKLLKHIPQDKQKGIRLESPVLLVFNQPILKNEAKEFLSIIGIDKDNKEIPVRFSIDHPSAKKLEEEEVKALPEMALLLQPEEKLPTDCTFVVEVKAGFPAKEGPLGLEKSLVFSFLTYRTFACVGLESEGPSNPNEPLRFQFTNPVSYKDFIKKVHFEPDVVIPDYYSEWEQGNETLWISLPFAPETDYSVKIDSDLTDIFGNELGKETMLEFKTSPFPSSVSMTTGYGILEAGGDLRYPLHALNAASVLFQGTRMTKNRVIPLLQTPKIFWSSEKASARYASFEVEKELTFSLPRNERQVIPLELKELVPEGTGFVFFQLDTRAAEKWDRYPKALLQVTNLGISAKFSPENNLVWVTELKTGMPVAEAEVEVRDDSNVVRWQGKTDSEGKVKTPGWKSFGLIGRDPWSKPRQWIFASREKDAAFISSEWGTGIDPYRFGIAYDWNPEPISIQGSIFTERGIYRAGEQVHVKGILRKRVKGQWRLPAVKEIQCEVQDPFQKSVFKEKVPLDGFGSFSFELETAEEASLGYYQIAVKVPPENEAEKLTDIYESFRVEAFRPAEFEIHLRSLSENFVFGQEYTAEIRSAYLFGGAMAGQKAAWHLRFNPAHFNPPGQNGYVFGNELDWGDEEVGSEESRLVSSGESTLNAEGKLEIKLPLVPEKEKDSVFAALEATVQSPSRRSISSRIQTVVHRGDYYIGLKPHTAFLKSGEKLAVTVIAATPEGTLVPKKKISLQLIKREWHSVRKAGIGSGFKWISLKEDKEVGRQEIQTGTGPVETAFQPGKSGFYYLLAEGQDSRTNKITTSTYLYVTGRDYIPWERRDDDTVELVADKLEYRSGDVAKILVKSPYEKAKALVTVERELILESKILDIIGSSTQVEIPIISDYMPNAFVSVLLVQGRSSPDRSADNSDVGKPSFKIGYVNLNVNPSEKQLAVDISMEKRDYRPKELVRLKLNVKGWKDSPAKASVAVAVVDVGVLNLIGYKTPNPFAQFYGQKPLSIETSETRLHVVGQRKYGEKGEDVGGGGEQKMMAPASLSEIELRGDFKSTAYWNPSLLTNEEGEASVSFTLPDNLTTFRVMAVAQTQASQFGQAETAFKVTKPLLLQASLPRFARLGDKFEGGVVLHNFSGKAGSGALDVDTKGIVLADGARTRSFQLEAGQSKEILYSFEVEKPGKADFLFRAKMGEVSDGLEVSLPLKEPRPTETVAFYDKTETSTEQLVTIPGDIYADQSRLEVQAAASAITGLKGCLDYLADYPYLCLEQRLSAVLPFILASDVILDFRLSPLDKKQMEKKVRQTLKEVISSQKESGGFGLWPDSSSASPYISCYAVFALIKAKEAGYEVEKARLEEAAVYLKNFLRQKPENEIYPFTIRNWKTTQAFALYDLALLRQPEPSYAERLFSIREELSLFAKTLLLKALHFGNGPLSSQATLLQELMNKAKVTPTQAHFEDEEAVAFDWIYSSNTRTTASILQTIIEVGTDSPLLPQIAQWLVAQRKSGRWTSTQENFYVFYALNDYYRSSEKTKPDFGATLILDKKMLLQERFTKPDQPISKAQVPLGAFNKPETLPLKIEKEGAGTLYYGARMTYAPRQKLPPRDEGMAVLKRIESLDGKPLEAIKVGSLVVVTLQVILPRESLFVAVDDPLPAGFEAVNPSFVTESEEQQRVLENLEKEDKDYRWAGFGHIEMRDDRVLLFADSLLAGIHTHRYLARALSIGLFQTPGTRGEEMYAPEVFGRTPEKLIKIMR